MRTHADGASSGERSYHKSNEEPSVTEISLVHLVLMWENTLYYCTCVGVYSLRVTHVDTNTLVLLKLNHHLQDVA